MACLLKKEFCSRTCGCSNCEYETNSIGNLSEKEKEEMINNFVRLGICVSTSEKAIVCTECKYYEICGSDNSLNKKLNELFGISSDDFPLMQ